jgi:peptidoglycan/xylan/chitin deacetylase (PgdA/CDA1 family)
MSDSFASLMYHNVVTDDDGAAAREVTCGLSPSITRYFVGAQRFASHLETAQRVADVMTYGDLQAFYASKSPSPAPGPRVLLTFDDGWRGSVDVAGPLLAERGLQALLFITTGLLGRPHFLTASELARLPRETFQIGSHTVTHPFLNELDDNAIAEELRCSKSTLEDITGVEVDALSIPNGAADKRVIRIAAETGYRFVCVSSVHNNTRRRGPLAIGRAAIRANTSLAAVARYATGDLGREQLRAALLSLPRRILGATRYRRLRGALLGERPDSQEMCELFGTSAAASCSLSGASTDARPTTSRRVVSSGVKP